MVYFSCLVYSYKVFSENTKLIPFWTCVSGILMHHPTFIGNWMQSFFHERKETKKCLQACLDQRRHFAPFVASCDRVLGNEAKLL